MTDILRETENEIWDFPTINKIDDSIVKYDYMKVYEDHHGSGSLEDATNFSFTTDNEDLWLLPSKGYLKINFYLRKVNGNLHQFQDVAAVGAQGGNPAVAAAVAEEINLCDNGYNLFEEGRYFIGDQEVERIDHVGISTLLQQLLEAHTKDKHNSIKHTQLLFFNDDDQRKNYVRSRRGHLHILLPVSKIFPFCKSNQHVFRGVKHRITLTLNNANRLIQKAAGVDDGKIYVEDMEWIIPYVEPSLSVMSKLETQLSATNEFNLQWEAINTFKEQPPRNREVRIPLAATVHKPTKIFLALQNINRDTSSEVNSMVFDNLELEEIYAEVNSVRFPEKPMQFHFGDDDFTEVYDRFLDQCEDKGSHVDFNMFKNKYPVICIDVSKHKHELFENSNFPTINLYLKFREVPAHQYIAWVIVCNERQATLNIENKKMRVIR